MTDSEIADLCRRIYQRHQRALDLIFEHRPDRQAQVQAILLDLVRARDDLIIDTASKALVRFAPIAWEGLPRGEGWTRSGRLILFQFLNSSDRVDLNLYVGPGPAEARQRLIDQAMKYQAPFRVPKGIGKKQMFKQIFSRQFLKPEDYQDAAMEDVEALIRTRWEEFVDRDLAAMVKPIQEAGVSVSTAFADGDATSGTTSRLASEAVRGDSMPPQESSGARGSLVVEA